MDEGIPEHSSVFHSFSGPSIDSSKYHTEALLQPIFKQGRLVYQAPDIHQSRANTLDQLSSV